MQSNNPLPLSQLRRNRFIARWHGAQSIGRAENGFGECLLDQDSMLFRFVKSWSLSENLGRVLTGLIAAETPSGITLRRAETAEDTPLRNQIDVSA